VVLAHPAARPASAAAATSLHNRPAGRLTGRSRSYVALLPHGTSLYFILMKTTSNVCRLTAWK
jgi:hypothetical protein